MHAQWDKYILYIGHCMQIIYDLTFYDLLSMINLTNIYTLVLTQIRKLCECW